MKAILFTVCLVTLHEVLAAPAAREGNAGADDIEQELIRHHHSLNNGLQPERQEQQQQQQQQGNMDAMMQAENNNEVDLLDDESLYDFTVADVLADIIYELKKNPVLLEQLIDSERQKVQRRLEEINLSRQDSYGDDLADFQKTAQQLDNAPMQVEKKAGRSSMNAMPAHLEDKRADEIIDDNYARNDVSEEVQDLENYLNYPHKATNTDQVSTGDKQAVKNTETRSSEDKFENNEQGSNYDMYNWIRYLPKLPAQELPDNPTNAEKQTAYANNTEQNAKVE